MSRLHARLTRQQPAAAAAGDLHPAGTADTPMVMPMARVYFGGGGAWVEQMMPMITANGAMIPATATGQYGQVYMAGNGRY